MTRPLYSRREQAGSGSYEGCGELGWGYLNHIFIQICGVAAGERASVPLVPYRPKEEISGLAASRWVFAHKRLDGGFAVEYYLVGVHEDVETASYVASVYDNGVSDENRDDDLKFSFNVRETFELSGENDSKIIHFE